ncbi:MAG TPA: YbaB/EbfC family nucleoid-associated protein [Pseudonocardiaceae bacterium]|nr:YbaB/EbfC family nucleoid-associated protein [Pseudonocardiaceae bacterium]
MYDTDTDEMERRLSQWTQGFAEKAKRFHAMRTLVEQVQVTESSRDGAVRVTVDSRGMLTDLALTDRIREMSAPELAAQVMACLRRAQQQLAPLVQDAMQATVGGDQPVVDKVVSGYRERFGEDLSTAPDPMVLGLGAIEGDTAPHRYSPPPRRQPRAAPSDDEEYFADRDYLR